MKIALKRVACVWLLVLSVLRCNAISMSTESFMEQKKPKIVVIGAGIAGLTTAYRLQEQGLDVQVYEARDRVGGRILSASLGDVVVELGGQNISDGGNAQHLHQLMDELDLEQTIYRISLDHR